MISDIVKTKMKTLLNNGYDVWIVGGYSLYCFAYLTLKIKKYGIPPKDTDLFTDCNSNELLKLFPNGKVIGGQARLDKVFTITTDNIEISTFRKNGDRTVLGSTIFEHQKTCDFDINSIAMSIDGSFIIPPETISHLKISKLAAMGNPQDRINEDHNRIMRAFRIAGKYNLYIEDKLYEVLKSTPIDKIPNEVIRDEFLKLLPYPHGMNAFIESGKFFELFPVLKWMQKFLGRCVYHYENVFDHSYKTYQTACTLTNDPIILFSCWVHDYGKPFVYNKDTKKFTGHEEQGVIKVKPLLDRLKVTNKDQKKILWIVEHHMYAKKDPSTRRKKWYTFFNKMDNAKVTIKEFLIVQYSDTFSRMIEDVWLIETAPMFQEWMMSNIVYKWYCEYTSGKYPKTIKQLKINGDDLILLGIEKGKQIGITLQRLLEMTYAEELTNDYKSLSNQVIKWNDKRNTSYSR